MIKKDEIILKKLLLVVEENIKLLQSSSLEYSSKTERYKLVFRTRMLMNKVVELIKEMSSSQDDEMLLSIISKIEFLDKELESYEQKVEVGLDVKKHI